MSEDILKLDKVYRRKLFLFYAFCLLMAYLIIHFSIPPIKALVLSLPTIQDQHMFVTDLTYIFLLSFTLPSLIIIRSGIKVIRQKQYPWIGMKAIYDMPYIRGAKAIQFGRRLVVLGLVCFVLVIVSANSLVAMNQNFTDDPMGWVSDRQWRKMERKMQEARDKRDIRLEERHRGDPGWRERLLKERKDSIQALQKALEK